MNLLYEQYNSNFQGAIDRFPVFEINDIKEVRYDERCINIIGLPGVGKTTLAKSLSSVIFTEEGSTFWDSLKNRANSINSVRIPHDIECDELSFENWQNICLILAESSNIPHNDIRITATGWERSLLNYPLMFSSLYPEISTNTLNFLSDREMNPYFCSEVFMQNINLWLSESTTLTSLKKLLENLYLGFANRYDATIPLINLMIDVPMEEIYKRIFNDGRKDRIPFIQYLPPMLFMYRLLPEIFPERFIRLNAVDSEGKIMNSSQLLDYTEKILIRTYPYLFNNL